MCTSFDNTTNQCQSCADEFVLVDYKFTDAASNSLEVIKICVLAEEHQFCESDLLQISGSKNIEVNILTKSVLILATIKVIFKQTLTKLEKNRYVQNFLLKLKIVFNLKKIQHLIIVSNVKMDFI